jgi:hypothetical protein
VVGLSFAHQLDVEAVTPVQLAPHDLGLSHLDSIQYRIGPRARETHLEGDL